MISVFINKLKLNEIQVLFQVYFIKQILISKFWDHVTWELEVCGAYYIPVSFKELRWGSQLVVRNDSHTQSD